METSTSGALSFIFVAILPHSTLPVLPQMNPKGLKGLRSCVGQEYKPQDLLFCRDKISCLTSSGVMDLKKKGRIM